MTNYHWLESEKIAYSRVSTCLALSANVYAKDSGSCLNLLNTQLKYLQHGISDLLYAADLPRTFLIAFKPTRNEVYIAFRGTENMKALLPSLKVFGIPNKFQGCFHSGYKDQANQIPLEPFYYFLDKNPTFKLIFTGHSLGGAIAAVVTSNMLVYGQTEERRKRISCIAFGAPFVCDEECSNYLNERYKSHFHFYINKSDIVPFIFCIINNYAENIFEEKEDVCNNIQACESWVSKLLHLQSLVAYDEKDDWFTFVKYLLSRRGCSSAIIDVIKATASLSKCFINLMKLLPMYRQFGKCFRTKSTTYPTVKDNRSQTEFNVEEIDIDKLMNEWKVLTTDQLINSFSTNIQDHFICSYIQEIHENVIVKQKLSLSELMPAAGIKLVSRMSNSPLSIFLTPPAHCWSWVGPGEPDAETKVEDKSNKNYSWSAVSCCYENEFVEISLCLCGPTVSLITELYYGLSINVCDHHSHKPYRDQNVIYEQFCKVCHGNLHMAKLQDANDECTRIFLLETSLTELPYLEYKIRDYLGIADFTSVFDKTKFISTNGLIGRKRQIAELSVLDLYKHALSYCLFTRRLPNEDQDSSDHCTGEDSRRRDQVKSNLLLCEELQKNIIQDIEKTWYKSNQQLIRQIKDVILDGKTKMNRFEQSLTKPEISSATRMPFSTTGNELNDSPIKMISLSEIMKNWEAAPNDSTEIISDAVPVLFAMYLSMTETFQVHALSILRSNAWTRSAAAVVVGASVVLTFTGIGLIYPIWIAGMAAVTMGVSISTIFYRYFSQMEEEYRKMLLLVAQSIGLNISRMHIHNYIIEKRISEIYQERISQYKNDDYVVGCWSKLFPNNQLTNNAGKPVIQHWLNLVKCIDAHYQLRQFLAEDFALGVVGGGKTGKSQLLASMFGFRTNPDLNERTTVMTSYRISDQFRVVDFPHMNSSIDKLRRCFTCHHSIVNMIIVVLNGEQRGDDLQTEGYIVDTIRRLAAEPNGIDVLFCFNRCDRLALCSPKHKSSGIKKRNQPSCASSERDYCQKKVYWTKEDTQKNKIEFATRAYKLKPENCMMTFFSLDIDDNDDKDWWDIHDALKAIDLSTCDDIKNIWLKNVLKKNGLEPHSIEQILKYEYTTD